jgi:hypothetical protein
MENMESDAYQEATDNRSERLIKKGANPTWNWKSGCGPRPLLE